MNLIKILLYLLGLVILIIFPFAYGEYQGQKFNYILFTIISTFALFYNFRKGSIFFETFFALLIWLGFWFKFSIQIGFLDGMFPEGFGKFSHSPKAYDEVIFVSQVAIFASVIASYMREKFIFNYVDLEKIKKEPKNLILFYRKYKKKIISILFFLIFICIITNLNFSFFQKGTVPNIILPFGLDNIFRWLLMFGFASFFTVIIYLEFLIKKKNSNNILKLSFLENFLSSISSLSRAMIFNSTAIFYGYYRLINLNNFEINKNKFVKYFLIICILFFISLLIVSKIRQQNNFPVGHQVHDYLPTIKNQNILILEPLNNVVKEVNQILFLIAGRWVGIDSLMAVQSKENKGYWLLEESFKEKFNYSNSFYENKIKGSVFNYKVEPKIYTIYVPGIVSYLYYTGSVLFVFFGIIFLNFFCSLIELFSYRMSKCNLIFSSLIGNVLAYRLAHFGYMPLNSYKILIAILINILILYYIFKVINNYYKK